ncbi:hypothetical protein K3495_g3446 [Podosphaera aphanis]|nr:hypothetical protein K3495_g3446 [Podosphaera aphanis]
MPTHRGIKLNIASNADLNVYPEFPHPESSQFTYRSPDFGKSHDDLVHPSASHESKADRLLGRQSVVSVYIPSFPGTRFWLRYSIEDIAAHQSKFYYFKLGANGENIVSWGINAKKNPEGQIMRMLCEPPNKMSINGEEISREKTLIESRWFSFSDHNISFQTKNHGFIEVRVFRVRGRKLRLPLLSILKNQNHGIRFPSQGLLAEPHKCKFYDWNLKDPTDNPFAIFKFHYRSWDLLQRLKVTSFSNPRTMLNISSDQSSLKYQFKSDVEASESLSKVSKGQVQNVKQSLICRRKIFGSSSYHASIPPGRMSPRNMWSSLVAIDKPISTSSKISGKLSDYESVSKSETKNLFLNHGQNLRPLSNISSIQVSRRPQTQKHLRVSSSISFAGSITPSLESHIEEIRTTAEISTARVLLISNSPSPPEIQSHVPIVVSNKQKSQQSLMHNVANFPLYRSKSSDYLSAMANNYRSSTFHKFLSDLTSNSVSPDAQEIGQRFLSTDIN